LYAKGHRDLSDAVRASGHDALADGPRDIADIASPSTDDSDGVSRGGTWTDTPAAPS
jgi:hypothetical protein